VIQDLPRAISMYSLVISGGTYRCAGEDYGIGPSRVYQLFWWLNRIINGYEYCAVDMQSAGIEFMRINKNHFLRKLLEYKKALANESTKA